jgi:hypothetical protein
MRESTLSVAGDDFAASVSSVTLTPSVSTVSFKGLKATSVHTETTSPTWTLDLAAAQDESDEGLQSHLWEGQGTSEDWTFTPKSGGRPWTVTVVLSPTAIGGAVDAYANFTVSLGVSGQPIRGELP